MKVVFVTPRPFGLAFGGLEVQLLSTKRYLEDLGVRVAFLDYFDRDLFKDVDLVHFFGAEASHYNIAQLLEGIGVPYVVSTVYWQYSDTMWRIRAKRLASVLPTTVRRLTRRFLLGAEALLPNSDAEAIQLVAYWGVNRDKIFPISNGVDPNFVGHGADFYRDHLRGFLSPTDPFVLSVARIDKRKNTLSLIKSILNLDVPLILVGPPYAADSEYACQVLEIIKQNSRFIRHIPFLSPGSYDLANAYAAAKVHALVSFFETPGLSNLEAGLNGANLVVGSCLPVEEYFTGLAYFVNPQDTLDITNKLEEALNASRDVFSQSAKIRDRYTWDKVAKKTLEIYQTVLQCRGKECV